MPVCKFAARVSRIFVHLLLMRLCSALDTWIQPSVLGMFDFQLLSTTRDGLGASVHRTLLESGFHRSLLTGVEVNVESDVAMIAIVENITRNQYVDIDQLSTLHSVTGDLQVVVSEHMDTEKPALLSTSHVLVAYSKLRDNRVTVKLPIHFRYQAPCEKRYMPVTIPPPLIFYPHRQDHSTPSDRIVRFPCNATTSELCEWHRLGYSQGGGGVSADEYCVDEECVSSGESSLVALIPCGGQDSVVVVAGLTVVVTLVAALYICTAITSMS